MPRVSLQAVSRQYLAAFRGLPRDAWVMAGALLVNTSGTMVVFFLTLYLVRELRWDVARAGLAMSGFGAGMLAGTLAGGLLSDRLGAFRVQRLSLAAGALVLAAIPALRSFAGVMAGTVAWGFCSSALSPANASAMAALCPEPVRARGFVLNRLANNLGATVGPVVGGFLALYDYRLLFWVDAATSLVASVVLLRLFPSARPASAAAAAAPSGQRAASPLRRDRVLLAVLGATFCVAVVFSQVFSTFGLYLKTVHGFLESRIGQLMAVNTVLIVLVQMQLTHLAERFSGAVVAAGGAVLLAAGFGLTPLAGTPLLLGGTVVVWTFGEMLIFPSLTTLVSLRAPSGAQGRYQGAYSMASSLGIVVGPSLGAWVYRTAGGTRLWLAVAALSLLAAGLLLAAAHGGGRGQVKYS